MKTLQWGIIGCGDVTEVKSGPGFAKAPRSALAMVMRRDGAKAEDYARRHNVPAWTDNAEELIRSDRVDAIYIATPPDTHADLTAQAARSGKPVLVEKPLANSLTRAAEVVAHCDEAGVPLFCAFYRRAMPRFAQIARLIGEIGPPSSVEILHLKRPPDAPYTDETLPWRLQPGPGDGGIFADMGSHMVNIVQHLVGDMPLGRVAGRAWNAGGFYPVVDTVEAEFTCAGARGDVPGHGRWCYVAEAEQDRITVTGRRGAVAFACFDGSDIELTLDGQTRHVAAPYPPHVHQPMIAEITAAILDGGETSVSGAAALATAEVQDRILAD